MRYLNTHNESRVKRTFVEWLDELEKKSGEISENIYEFEFPVKKIYNVSENADVNYFPNFLKSEKNIDICDIIANEIELDFLEKGEAYKEEIEANFDKYFEQWIEQKFDGDVSSFYRLYDLDFEKNEISEDDFNILKDGFNSLKLEEQYPYKEYNQDFKIESMSLIQLKDTNKIIGKFETNRILNEDEVDSIKDFLTNQCSDEWGKSILQPKEEKINNLAFDTYILVWWGDGYPGWDIEIEEKF